MQPFWRVLLTIAGLWLLAAVLLFQPINTANTPRTSCESNMMQLGLAMLQYTQESDGILPSIASSGGHGWREMLYPYVKSVGVYQCPDDQSSPAATPEHLPHSYGANAAVMTEKAMTQSARSILLADVRGYDGPEWNMTSPAFLPATGRELYAHPSRHYFFQHPSGTLNVLFADGHVKALTPMETLTPINFWTPGNTPFTGQELGNAQAILKHAESE